MVSRLIACCLLAVVLIAADDAAGDPDDVDLDSLPSASPTLEDFGYFLSRLDERSKSNALNILADLSSDSRLDPAQVADAPPLRLHVVVAILVVSSGAAASAEG